MSEEISQLKEAEKQDIAVRKDWTGGAILIGLGLVFLLSNLEIISLHNWWALFILMPAIVTFSHGWRSYREHGRFTHEARGQFTGSAILFLVAGTFIFGWSWALIWPCFLIIGGLGAIWSNR
jgi:hypothetical protein